MVIEFTVAYFPLMKLNDLVVVTNIFSIVDVLKLTEANMDAFILGFSDIKTFLDGYYEYLAIIDIDLALVVNKAAKMPQSLLKSMNIDKFEDGVIIHQPFGMVFQGKNKKGI